MKAPDRIWARLHPNGQVFSSAMALPGWPEYLRATPELLALIEAAKADGPWMAKNGCASTPVNKAALAFAKSQDRPDDLS